MQDDGASVVPPHGLPMSISNGSGKTTTEARGPGASNGAHKPVPSSLNGSHGVSTQHSDNYDGHDRQEITRILIQALSDMGYDKAAASVKQDSGYELENPTVSAFRKAITGGDWGEAENILTGAAISGDKPGQADNGLVLTRDADRDLMRFWLRQQKYLEFLEVRDSGQALLVLRTELTPLSQDTPRLHFLATLIMCNSANALKAKAEWDGAAGLSRQILLSRLSKCISPSVMLPEHRLSTLLHQVKDSQTHVCLWHTDSTPPSLYADHICDSHRFPSETVLELDEHNGEVWNIVFSHDGTRLASCGSDKQVIIWEVPSFKVLHYLRGHEDGVGNVSWSWDDSLLVTCSRDNYARLWDTHTGLQLVKLDKFQEPVSGCIWAPDGRSFVTGSFDMNRSLIQWDVSGEKIFDWGHPHRVEDLAASPDGRWMVTMNYDSHIRVYNLATRGFEYELDLGCRIVSVSISHDSHYLILNYKDGFAHLLDLATKQVILKYTGQQGGDCIIRTVFGGANEAFVASGSEDGTVNVWHKASGILVLNQKAHTPRCNSVSWSPADPRLFATCGDDGKIKIWSNNEWRTMRAQDSSESNGT